MLYFLNTKRLHPKHKEDEEELISLSAKPGNSLDIFINGMLCKFCTKHEFCASFDLRDSDFVLLALSWEFDCLTSQLIKDIIDKTVHDSNGLHRNTQIWMDRLENPLYAPVECLSHLLLLSALLFPTLRHWKKRFLYLKACWNGQREWLEIRKCQRKMKDI